MKFPHLKDTDFPNFNNVDVYAFRNEFDYTRWTANSRVTLTNVLWDSKYTDVVKFESDEARDKWFDEQEDTYSITIDSHAQLFVNNTVKLPIPYDVLARYNYCFVDVPIATSENHPIDYETDWGYRRWYYFIDSIAYAAPNTTVVTLSVDVWTQYINDMKFKYMMLERGHAPVAASDTDEYLANPKNNSKYLLAPDVNYDNTGIVRSGNYIPVGNGTKYVCFASTIGLEHIRTIKAVDRNSEEYVYSKPTYSNTTDRWGYQYQVNGYGIGSGSDFSNAAIEASAGVSTNGLIPNNVTVYAIEADTVYSPNSKFFVDMISTYPHFIKSIVACFIVSEDMITIGAPVTIGKYSFNLVNGAKNTLLSDYTLKRSDFNYPEKYERFAKLYTHPYAVIELTDNDGTTKEVKIEETGSLSCNLLTSVAFPFIDIRVYFEGIGGESSQSYEWRNLTNRVDSLEMQHSDWGKYCFDWKIPTYALYMDGETSYLLNNFNRSVKNARAGALASYHNSVRGSNTAYENELAASTTANANAYDSANTDKANADRVADTEKINTDDAMDTSIANQVRSNAANRYNTDAQIALATYNTGRDAYYGTLIMYQNNNLNSTNQSVANTLTQATTNANVEQTNTVAFNNAVASTGTIATGTIGGIAAGGAAATALGVASGVEAGSAFGIAGGPVGIAAGAVIGGLVGLIGGALATTMSQSNASATVSQTQTVSGAAVQAATDTVANTNLAAETNQIYNTVPHLEDVTRETNNTNSAVCNNNNNMALANITASANTTKNNATRNQTTSKTNALAATNTVKSNSDRTKTTSQSNAGYTREANVLNAKESLENQQRNSMAALNDSRNATPVQVCVAEGNSKNDYFMVRGIQMKVRTQSDSAIAQTGDMFARYGYTLNQNWNMDSGFNLMKHFTYWKANDVWIDDVRASNAAAQQSIESILVNGVTVWSNPTEIGKVSIYDN